MERHWKDENAACAMLWNLGLDREDVIEEVMRSPRQVEIRAKSRGLKLPPEIIDLRRSGTSLVRSENVRVPVPRQDDHTVVRRGA
jgi:hypothetical protein